MHARPISHTSFSAVMVLLIMMFYMNLRGSGAHPSAALGLPRF